MVIGGLGLLALAAAGLWVWQRGGLAAAAADLGAGAINAAGGAVSGAVGAVGAAVGLPTPDQTTDDEYVVRWLYDSHGWIEASKWATVPAMVRATLLPPGSGRPPVQGSLIARSLGIPDVAPAPSVAAPGAFGGITWGELAAPDAPLILYGLPPGA